LWSAAVGDVWSNGPLKPAFKLPDSNRSRAHCALDLGEEEFTVGRPHPMIDNDLRIRRLLQEAADPTVAVIQLDLVLGYGAHPDPARELAPAIRQAREIAARAGRELLVISALTGTDDDPQNFTRQAQAFSAAGVTLCASNSDAARLAALIVNPNA
ncbi:MAG: FdrA family protein, partial [Chloroflexi bacterium]|nr:FdrA family protein [Chloroflexota bacterium]